MVNSIVERATNDMLIGPDWAINLEICDMLNQDPGQVKDVVKRIKKRIGSKNSKVQLLALTLLETIVKNCGDIVHMHVAERDIPHEMVKLVKKKPDFHVKEKILIMIDTWQEAFGGPRGRYPQYYAAYQELLRAGAVFPQKSERSAPVFTPPQTHPLSSYPPNLRNSENLQETGEASSEAEYPTLSLTEIQNARGIMDVLAEMLSAINPANKQALRQEVIVDLIEQCRAYKQRVVHLVNSTADESLLCQGLALNDDLQKVLAKHEAIVTGIPAPQEKPKLESSKAVVDVDAPLVDTGESSKQGNARSATGSAIPAAPVNGAVATPTKVEPSIDLLSGDLLSGDAFSSSATPNTLALVPVSAPQPSSPVASHNNALALVDMFSTTNNATPDPLNSQPAFPAAGQTYSFTQDFQQQQNTLHPPQSTPYANGVATSVGLPQYEQSGAPQTPLGATWSPQTVQQQPQSPSSVYGTESGGTLPPPPWESQQTETNQPFSPQYSSTMQVPTMAGQQSQTFQGGMHPFAPQPSENDQVAGMYAHQQMTGGQVPTMNAQPMQNHMASMYPQAYQGGAMMGMVPPLMPAQMSPMYPQMYGNQMAAYGGYGYAQPPGAQYLDQRMYGLSMRDDTSLKTTSSQTSMASYLPPMKQQPKGDDKLFGDLVDMSKFKSGKPSPSRTGSV